MKIGDRVLVTVYPHHKDKAGPILPEYLTVEGVVSKEVTELSGKRDMWNITIPPGIPGYEGVTGVHRWEEELVALPPNCTEDQVEALIGILGGSRS